MESEIVNVKRGTTLRQNKSQKLHLDINENKFNDIFLINGNFFLTKGISNSDLIIQPESYYMIINNGKTPLEIYYNQNISSHKIIYDPYKFESSMRINLTANYFIEKYNIPDGYIDTLPKWYSFKFSYANFNLIFLRPEFGLSIQIHNHRNEYWEILDGKPIVLNGNNLYYFAKNGTKFQNVKNTFHSVINPNKEKGQFILIKERWDGFFDENDITRVFNPNHYE
ncbi:MAG: hypothetical protein JSV62_03635 [Promethearchaeota archaeon]|nr:MAG: hypothetical protein JSV62_03635 [Candidatus Lokiarchaeota archaeon]